MRRSRGTAATRGVWPPTYALRPLSQPSTYAAATVECLTTTVSRPAIIVEGKDGAWLAVGVKPGVAAIDEAADGLRRVTAKMVRPPQAQIIIVPSGVAYRREDGVHVIPLTVLGP